MFSTKECRFGYFIIHRIHIKLQSNRWTIKNSYDFKVNCLGTLGNLFAIFHYLHENNNMNKWQWQWMVYAILTYLFSVLAIMIEFIECYDQLILAFVAGFLHMSSLFNQRIKKLHPYTSINTTSLATSAFFICFIPRPKVVKVSFIHIKRISRHHNLFKYM